MGNVEQYVLYILTDMDIRAKKSLGQHFLKSQSALRSIIAEAKISPDDTVLEVGPGKGVLTEKILATDFL